MKRILITANLLSRGLKKDAVILSDAIHSADRFIDINIVQDDIVAGAEHGKHDITIHCERISWRDLVSSTEGKHWLLVNPEFLFERDIPAITRHFEKVLCKTMSAYQVCNAMFPGRAVYIGFTSDDRYQPLIQRSRSVLHIAGKSAMKGTQAVINAWMWRRNGKSLQLPLHVVSSVYDGPVPDKVKVHKEIPEDGLLYLQNASAIHIQPSATEGFGHVIREAMSTDNIVITTGAPPMDEIEGTGRLPFFKTGKLNFANLYEVSAASVFEAIEPYSSGDIVVPEPNTRARYLIEKQEFYGRVKTMVDELDVLSRPRSQEERVTNPHIGFLGNFDSPHSTENQILWALERLGCDVLTVQENKATDVDLITATHASDVFLWVRTPGWLRVPPEKVLEIFKSSKIPKVSLHLDRFWGIPEREAEIGFDPFWKTDFVFTADGGNQDKFAERGVPHCWLKPAVSEVYCHPGTFRPEYACDVGFVGAENYHACYPFRKKLIEFLRFTYEDHFKLVQGVRGHELNDVYASMKVVVGDCIFAGAPYYWSDRVPETIGRGGFLIHPTLEGFDYPVFRYEAQDLASLQDSIEQALGLPKHHRDSLIEIAGMKVHKEDTWTVRMDEILKRVL